MALKNGSFNWNLMHAGDEISTVPKGHPLLAVARLNMVCKLILFS